MPPLVLISPEVCSCLEKSPLHWVSWLHSLLQPPLLNTSLLRVRGQHAWVIAGEHPHPSHLLQHISLV